MILADLPLPISYEDSRQYTLVFTPQLAACLQELHLLHGRPDCVAVPTLLVDGRLSLPATLLTATLAGGWLHEMWEAADKSVLMEAVGVISASEAAVLIPAPPAIG
jgi:hypothetical protein